MKSNKIISSLIFSVLFSGLLLSCTPIDSGENNGDTSEDDDTTIDTPVLEDATKYFNSTVSTQYLTRNSYLADFDGNSINFDNLVQREISLLSQDILYRLYAVYGGGAATTEPNGSTYNLIDNDTEFSYDGNLAQINNDSLIQTPYRYTTGGKPVYLYSTNVDYYNNSANVDNPLINELATYSYNYTDGLWTRYTIQGRTFNNTYSILGGYEYSSEDGFGTTFNRNDYTWNWGSDLGITTTTTAKDGFSLFYSYNKSVFEDNIANIIAGTSSLAIGTAIDNINSLGFTNANLTSIISYIKSTVIGSSLITEDDAMLTQLYSVLGGYELNSTNAQLLTGDYEYLHYYKAYSLLIPAIVEQAANLTFANTTQSIYLSGNRVAENSATSSINTLLDKNFTEIILTAKNNNTKLTKMVISISDIDVSNLELHYTITSADGGNIIASLIPVVLASGDNAELDFSSYSSHVLTNTGTIALMFSNATSQTFSVVINGYYNSLG